MMIQLDQLLRLPVETEGGIKLGQVSSLVIDIDTHAIRNYVVKTSHLPKPLAHELLIAPSAVISITEEKMVVDNAAVPEGAPVVTPAA